MDKKAAALKGGPVWLITFAAYRRKAVFGNPDLRQVCAKSLEETCTRQGYRVYALAIMPDHVHMVLAAGHSGHGVSKVLNNVKGVSSRRVFRAGPELKLDLRSEHLWTDEYQARPLRDRVAVEKACSYVEENRTKLGLPKQRYPSISSWRPAL